jgi:carboxypeptidase C (cathepsin A)
LNEDSLHTSDFKETGVPSLFRNPYTWSKLGNLLMFDWPPPVGFSFCGGQPSGNGTSCGDWDDERMAETMHAALRGWFDAFPERVGKPLYLTGESYAGALT